MRWLVRVSSVFVCAVSCGFLICSSLKADAPMGKKRPFVIAHRGASGYLPEHTLEAKALAHAQRAEYLEQDVVLTKDDVPVVLHDIHLDTISNVAELFPGRARSDGRFYAIDFTVDEIRQLNASERFNHKTGEAVFPNRFPPHKSRFQIPTLEEEIQFIQGLNKSTGRVAGIYPEIKQPTFHAKEGKDICKIIVDVLHRNGYKTKEDPCFIQCFEEEHLRRVREELRCQLRLIQLLDGKACDAAMKSPAAMVEAMNRYASFADGVGPYLTAVLPPAAGSPETHPFPETGYKTSLLVDGAHAAKLEVHPWTCREDELPKHFKSSSDLHRDLVQVGIDGVFSDFPGPTRAYFTTFTE
ncbi:glycerophosphodiester phosphodiesterase [Planctomicrobium sp. SH527]|uniref:glycerophosphodiester phosphodiesterase n=1 Tax=Planctomicrobium sp. SH527 TaxID=3448123 RepID=UPI003F5B2EE9